MENETFERILNRERNARKEAERIMEEKSLELLKVNESLVALNVNLEKEISERTKEIKKNADQLNILFNKNPFPVIVYDKVTLEILDINSTAIEKYKYTKEIFLEKTVFDLHPNNEKIKLDQYLTNSKLNHPSFSNWKHLDGHGNSFDVLVTSNTIQYNDTPSRIAIIEDVTEKNKLKKEKDLQKKKYQDFIENSSDFIFRINSKGDFIYMNPSGIKFSGYSEIEILKMNFYELVAPEYLKRVSSFYRFQLDQKLETTYTEFPIITKDGSEFWIGQNVEASEFMENGDVVYNSTARNYTERKKLEKALIRSEEKYRSIIENMELGLIEVDTEGVITKAYPKFCLLTGYSSEELEGTNGKFLLDNEGLEIMQQQTSDRKDGLTNLYEIQLIRKNKTKIWVMISAAPFYDAYNRFKGSVGIHLDITKRKTLENQLIHSKTHAEKLLQSKEIFIANVSHEIRTPLNAIIGITELMLSSVNDKLLNEQLGHVSHAGKGLLQLINELLIISKINANKLTLKPSNYSLKKCLENNFELHKSKANEKDLLYKIELDIPDNSNYYFDHIKLGQVIQNLISNALKFTQKGHIKLEASLVNSSHLSDTVLIKVMDTGIGIPVSNLNSIFDNFEQADNNQTGEYGGTGLGLSIVKKTLSLMGSEINVISENGNTQFEFVIKINKQEQEEQISENRIEQKMSLNGTKILVAEDNMANQFLIENVLKQLDASYSIVNNGLEAIEFLKSNNADVVLMDMRMPVLNGIEATKEIRENKLHEGKPIIALTANADENNKSICLASGMNEFLTKPYTTEDLYDKIVHCLGLSLHKTKGRAVKVNEEIEDDFQKKLIAIFIQESNLRLIKLKEAILNEDYEIISDICHSMRPSLLHLNQNDLVDKAKKIESGENLKVNSRAFVTDLEEYLDILNR